MGYIYYMMVSELCNCLFYYMVERRGFEPLSNTLMYCRIPTRPALLLYESSPLYRNLRERAKIFLSHGYLPTSFSLLYINNLERWGSIERALSRETVSLIEPALVYTTQLSRNVSYIYYPNAIGVSKMMPYTSMAIMIAAKKSDSVSFMSILY